MPTYVLQAPGNQTATLLAGVTQGELERMMMPEKPPFPTGLQVSTSTPGGPLLTAAIANVTFNLEELPSAGLL